MTRDIARRSASNRLSMPKHFLAMNNRCVHDTNPEYFASPRETISFRLDLFEIRSVVVGGGPTYWLSLFDEVKDRLLEAIRKKREAWQDAAGRKTLEEPPDPEARARRLDELADWIERLVQRYAGQLREAASKPPAPIVLPPLPAPPDRPAAYAS